MWEKFIKEQLNVNIIEVLKDRKLLGLFLKDPETWEAWSTFLRAFFGLPAETGDLTLFQKATVRRDWPNTGFSEAWIVIGTRGSKSVLPHF